MRGAIPPLSIRLNEADIDETWRTSHVLKILLAYTAGLEMADEGQCHCDEQAYSISS
jgi:hypothetical protein